MAGPAEAYQGGNQSACPNAQTGERIDGANISELTRKQKAFIEELSKNQWNGTQAAIAAGYSAKSAGVMACRLHKNSAVAKELEKRSGEIEQKTDIEIAEIIAALRDIAFGGKKATNSERLRALELLGKHKAMFTDKMASDVNMGAFNVVDIMALMGVEQDV